MTSNNKILIKNVYHMLAYALPALAGNGYTRVASEDFDHIHDLMASILITGLSHLYKRGLHHDYISVCDNLTTMRGQLNISETIRNKILLRHKLACNFDEFSDNNINNQIIKTTLIELLQSADVSTEHRNTIKKLLRPLWHINTICPSAINWSGTACKHHHKNSEYSALLTICRFVLNDMLHTTASGTNTVLNTHDLLNDTLATIYQKFVLSYYQCHYPHLHPYAPYIRWALSSSTAPEYLPGMHTDVVLTNGLKTLIIDTKFYKNILSKHYDKDILNSGNIYQIITYVLNMATYKPNVSGMLLYAQTDSNCPPPNKHQILNHEIAINILDLNQDFIQIQHQLNTIADTYFSN
ncbi:MAG: 5-methylcytosine-specific restriction endonuclease system specificity protein McrC [Alphaproteobacteria bacterium]|nr:5-methylcytosine-specific restriction endonuclease system specificity protein McrC [Alphaproteobacteria bacterium]